MREVKMFRDALLLALCMIAFVLVFVGSFRAEAASGDGHPYWSHTATIGTTAQCIRTEGGSGTNYTTDCTLFPAGDTPVGGPSNLKSSHAKKRVVISASAAGRCFYSMVNDLDVGATGTISDAAGPNGSGSGALMTFSAAGVMHKSRPSRTQMSAHAASGYRGGLCSLKVTKGGDSVYPPCTNTQDCTDLSAGTCVSAPSSTQQMNAGLYLICDADASTVIFGVHKEVVE